MPADDGQVWGEMKQMGSVKQSLSQPLVFYHISPSANVRSILKHGVDPAFSQSHPERVYFVCKRDLHWAIEHVSVRHGVSREQLAVFRVGGGKLVKKLPGHPMYYCEHPKRVNGCWSAASFKSS